MIQIQLFFYENLLKNVLFNYSQFQSTLKSITQTLLFIFFIIDFIIYYYELSVFIKQIIMNLLIIIIKCAYNIILYILILETLQTEKNDKLK